MSENEKQAVTNELVHYIKRDIFALRLRNGDKLEREVIARQCDIDLFTADGVIATLGERRFARTYMANKIAVISFSSHEVWELSNWLCKIGGRVIPNAVRNLNPVTLDKLAERVDLIRRCGSAEAAHQSRIFFHHFLSGDAPWKAKQPIRCACVDQQKYLEYYLQDRKRKLTYSEFLDDFLSCLETENYGRACEVYEWYTLLFGRTTRDMIRVYNIH